MNFNLRFFVLSFAVIVLSASDYEQLRVFIAAKIACNAHDELTLANKAFTSGNYADALKKLTKLSLSQPDNLDLKLAMAACHVKLKDSRTASQVQRDIEVESSEDALFCALVHAQANDFRFAQKALKGIRLEDIASDMELLEALALAAAYQGNKPAAWQYLRLIQKHNSGSAAIDRLINTGLFSFISDWFGTGFSSLSNYTKGFGGGIVDWCKDFARGIWGFICYPLDTMSDVYAGIKQIFTPENLSLLLSTTKLLSAICDFAANVYWSAWESCKLSVTREYRLNPEKYEHQRDIHEIAAGRMLGYVAPDLALIILSGSATAGTKMDKVAKASQLTRAGAQVELQIEKVNQIARSASFLSDAEKYPKLRSISWLSDTSWEVLKSSSRVSPRIEHIVDAMHSIRHVPGAHNLVKTIVSRIHLEDVDGYLFQLSRAGNYAKENNLAEIGARFRISVTLPNKPVKIILRDADLVLKDGTLIEMKHRYTALTLDEKLNVQLLKYDQAVTDQQIKRIVIECNTTVSKAVKDRCEVIKARGTPIEVRESIPYIK
ncbi:MAG TPA: hypothetical protein PKA06_05180 [Gemmatales bacterium]|nr:hypothetical protein [Gemmatales bacterium]